jgi:rod shape-determining protein MreC
MRNLFQFLFQFRGVLVFSLLQVVSLFLYVTNSSYPRAAFFNSANAYAGLLLARRTQVTDYFHLAEQNQALAAENAALRQQLFRPDTTARVADSLQVPPDPADSLHRPRYQRPAARPDTLVLALQKLAAKDPSYPLIPARVINNTLRNVDNYLTLNVGTANGVQEGQGVVASTGVVGRVMVASEHYATVASVLHSKIFVTAKIKRDGTVGSLHWPGDDPTIALLNYVPRQNKLVRGDTIVTSGYNAIFPEGLLIGTIESFIKEPDKNFWTVRVKLGVDFSKLTYVYVVRPRAKVERDTVEARTGIKPEEEGRDFEALVARQRAWRTPTATVGEGKP